MTSTPTSPDPEMRREKSSNCAPKNHQIGPRKIIELHAPKCQNCAGKIIRIDSKKSRKWSQKMLKIWSKNGSKYVQKMVQIWFKNDEKCNPARVRNISRYFSRKMSGAREWCTLRTACGTQAFVLFLASYCKLNLGLWPRNHGASQPKKVPLKGTFF